MDTSTALGVVATIAVIWLFARPSKLAEKERLGPAPAAASRGTNKPSKASFQDAFSWPPLGEFDFEVVGESNYQSAIAEIAGQHGEEGATMECVAQLIPEDDNRYDPKAIAVRINGRMVGYLSREDARSFRRRLGQKGLTGRTTSCAACIVGGGTKRSGERLFYGVKLDIKPFE